MIDWRTLMMGVAAFGATFAGGMWLNGGGLPSLAGLSLADIKLPSALAGTPPVAASGPAKPRGISWSAAPAGASGPSEGITRSDVARGVRVIAGHIARGRASNSRRSNRSRRVVRFRFRFRRR
jgi:hypothetical protein